MGTEEFKKTEHDKKMPYTLHVMKADNGFVVQAGCTTLVKEGTGLDLAADLGKYLDCDGSTLKKYGMDIEGAYAQEDEARREVCCEQPMHEARTKSTVYTTYIKSEKAKLLESVYEARNGVIIIDHKREMAFVKENKKPRKSRNPR